MEKKNKLEIFPPILHNAYFNKDGSVRIVSNDKWGCLDTTGKEIIHCKYDYMSDFKNGLAEIELQGKFGYIDILGNELFDN